MKDQQKGLRKRKEKWGRSFLAFLMSFALLITVFPPVTFASSDPVTVRFTGTREGEVVSESFTAYSLEYATRKARESGIELSSITDLEFESGTVDREDFQYLGKSIVLRDNLHSFSCDLDEDLTLDDTWDYEVNTSLLFNLYKDPAITVSLQGWPKLHRYSVYAGEIEMPDVTVLDHAELKTLNELDLSKIEVISNSEIISPATSISLPSVTTVIDNPFLTSSLDEVVFGPGLERLEETEFGSYAKPEPQFTHYVFQGETAPEMVGRIFFFVNDNDALVTFPAAGLTSYLGEEASGVMSTSDLPDWLHDQRDVEKRLVPFDVDGAHKITYVLGTSEEDTDEVFAFVPEGDVIGENRLATLEVPEGKVLTWNTAADGTGTTFRADSTLPEDVSVYPVFVDAPEFRETYTLQTQEVSLSYGEKATEESILESVTVIHEEDSTQAPKEHVQSKSLVGEIPEPSLDGTAQTVTVKVVYSDGTEETTEVSLTYASAADSIDVATKEEVKANVGDTPEPDEALEEPENLPEGIKVEWKEEPDTSTAGEKTITLVLKYPDASSEQVDLKLLVEDPPEDGTKPEGGNHSEPGKNPPAGLKDPKPTPNPPTSNHSDKVADKPEKPVRKPEGKKTYSRRAPKTGDVQLLSIAALGIAAAGAFLWTKKRK